MTTRSINPHISPQKLRQEIAQIAAKLIAVDGVNDYLTAKRKAAIQIGISPDKHMPTNYDVEQALINYQKLFQANSQPEKLKAQRLCAIRAMKFLSQFEPRITGPVLTGTATEYSEIDIHIHSDEPEKIGLFLDEHAIPYTCCEKTIKVNPTKSMEYPAYRFIAEEIKLILIVFPEKQKNLIPISSITGKPMTRADVSRLELLCQ